MLEKYNSFLISFALSCHLLFTYFIRNNIEMKVLAKDIERRRLNNLSWGRLLITFAFHYILFYFSVIYLILLAKEINEAKVLRE